MAETDPNKTDAPADPAISRRDFLRRAGKEAAVTGTKILPGAAIATKVLGISEPSSSTGKNPDDPANPGLVAKIAAWRRRQRRESESSSK